MASNVEAVEYNQECHLTLPSMQENYSGPPGSKCQLIIKIIAIEVLIIMPAVVGSAWATSTNKQTFGRLL